MASRRSSVIHVDDEKICRMSVNNPDFTHISDDAAKATEVERNMTLLQGLKIYPKAVGWSILLSAAIIMEGFDIVLIANLLAVPAFKNKFGVQLADGSYEVTAAWQSGLTNGAYCGEILGLMINGIIAEKYGFKKTMISALTLVASLIFIVFFVQNIEQLLIGLILLGIPWGVFQTLTTTYAAEVCPVPLRAYLTTYVNLCWVMGQFLASGVLKGVSTRNDEWAYRIPYALQWIWPIPLIIGIALAPESPWWLVRKERLDDAKKMVLRLTSRNQAVDFSPDETVAMMQHTNEMEKMSSRGATYLDCFKGTDLYRTEICAMTWFTQAFCGSSFMGFSTYFFEQAGLDTSNAFSMSLGQYALGAVGTFLAWYLMQICGRRTLYVWGQAILCALLLIIGFCGIASKDNTGAQWAIGTMLLIFTFVYDSTVGPVCYSLVAEMPSTRLRQKTVVLARNFYNIASIIGNILTPRMLNPSAWNWGAKSAFFWAGTCFLCFVWTYFRLPEPRGRTYGELDTLFEQRVSARKFTRTDVDLKGNGAQTEGFGGEKKAVTAHLETMELART
ncbi:MFS alpha-glucoside transporter-like protein [Lindgomyces ingoldianus]|uniref:MFS alpha-glucoside transporter-like protein n=1 Tax=Lindgomyces ingoldianus TaxID=673940 RepID=A0ACB6R8H4_9PLEO|nr:MFS alpha-glucoside transporter-like protein [Lindgomyces ingoldianus]KAF2474622.1 MFS alpha-glucoside transporter-like protein [Lindgomyces ingoldianus]